MVATVAAIVIASTSIGPKSDYSFLKGRAPVKLTQSQMAWLGEGITGVYTFKTDWRTIKTQIDRELGTGESLGEKPTQPMSFIWLSKKKPTEIFPLEIELLHNRQAVVKAGKLRFPSKPGYVVINVYRP